MSQMNLLESMSNSEVQAPPVRDSLPAISEALSEFVEYEGKVITVKVRANGNVLYHCGSSFSLHISEIVHTCLPVLSCEIARCFILFHHRICSDCLEIRWFRHGSTYTLRFLIWKDYGLPIGLMMRYCAPFTSLYSGPLNWRNKDLYLFSNKQIDNYR